MDRIVNRPISYSGRVPRRGTSACFRPSSSRVPSLANAAGSHSWALRCAGRGALQRRMAHSDPAGGRHVNLDVQQHALDLHQQRKHILVPHTSTRTYEYKLYSYIYWQKYNWRKMRRRRKHLSGESGDHQTWQFLCRLLRLLSHQLGISNK